MDLSMARSSIFALYLATRKTAQVIIVDATISQRSITTRSDRDCRFSIERDEVTVQNMFPSHPYYLLPLFRILVAKP